MTGLKDILIRKFPKPNERIDGQLIFLDQYEIVKLDCKALHDALKLHFFKAKFLIRYGANMHIDIVCGISNDDEIFLLMNPLISDRYSNLVNKFEDIRSEYVNQTLLADIIDVYKETGANITKLNDKKYQIWYGDHKWRVLDFEVNDTLKIRTTPNKNLVKWWQRLFGVNK